ncbi:sugar MFS transporter [Lutimonas zeaxanthinifaciens]|uniref:sugar MFS transporter n=1 Tax=Lutimonas zeaxanthinifaciens TaxID=3060215 RepID=UPI00265D33BA|nr:sugar MFS transporter [Lutimonas sp. YSD2104]WKK64997.1 sugar MFS transporter [Lutimonas sp. YSD2104]
MSKQSSLVPLMIIAALFFIFGFVTWINGALIPFMKTINELTAAQSYLVASASYISFVVMALPSSAILAKTGYRKGMSIGLFVMALGALVFIPAANARTYWVFLLGIFIQGAGMTLLQTAANPYVTILGPIESAAKRISVMGIANKVAGALGSLIFGALLLSGIDEVNEKLKTVSGEEKNQLLDTMADSVFVPYIIMAVVLFVLGILIRKAPLPHVEAEPIKEEEGAKSVKTSIFQFPQLILGVIALFMYVGVEVIAGDSIIAYGLSLGLPVSQAKWFTTFTLFAMVGTYALGVILIPKYMSQTTALRLSGLLGIVLSLVIVNTSGFTSVLLVAALGIANALVWPAIWPLAIDGLGKFTKTGAAFLIMAISGGAILTPMYGRLVDYLKEVYLADGMEEVLATSQSANQGYWILLPAYIIIFLYALKGHKIKSWR